MQERPFSQSVENSIAAQKYGIGQPVMRKEDDTLVRGKGRYTDDVNLPGQLYGVVVRSTHAHGTIKKLDASAARKMPGVLGVWTGEDMVAAGYGNFVSRMPLKSRDGTPLLQTNKPILAMGKVRFVGDPIAFVVAETVNQARDAAEAGVLDIDALPAVPRPSAAPPREPWKKSAICGPCRPIARRCPGTRWPGRWRASGNGARTAGRAAICAGSAACPFQ